jgi:anti-sigma B factor antagonist
MALSKSQTGDISIVALSGSIDSKTAPGMRDELLAALQETKSVIINMTAVEYLSSAGLRLLLLAYRDITAKSGRVVLVGVSEEIQEVMANTGFIKFFQLANTEPEAVAALA